MYDYPTQIAHGYAEYCAAYARQIGHDVEFLEGNDVTPEALQARLAELSSAFLDVYGHGLESALHGQNGIPLVSCRDIDETRLLSQRIVDAFCCLTALELGPAAVSEGCTAYIGYTSDTWVFEPGEDREVLTTAKRRLYDGWTCDAAFSAQQTAMRSRIQSLQLSGDRDLVAFQEMNLAGYVLLGSGQATISPGPS